MRKLKRLFYSASELKGATCEVSSIVSTHETCLVLDVFDTRSAFFFSKLLTYSCLCELNSWTPEYSLDWTSVFLSFSQSLSVPEKDPNRVCVNWFRVRLHVRLYSYFNETHVDSRLIRAENQEKRRTGNFEMTTLSLCEHMFFSCWVTTSDLLFSCRRQDTWIKLAHHSDGSSSSSINCNTHLSSHHHISSPHHHYSPLCPCIYCQGVSTVVTSDHHSSHHHPSSIMDPTQHYSPYHHPYYR